MEKLINAPGYTEQFTEVEGHQLHGLVRHTSDELTPIVIMPGILLSDEYWQQFTEATGLFNERSVLQLSLPGHQPSTTPSSFTKNDITPSFMAKVVDTSARQAFGERPYIALGHSTGGFAALNVGLYHPERLKAAVSIAGFDDGHWGGGEGLLQRLADGNSLQNLCFRGMMRVMMSSYSIYNIASASLTKSPRSYLKNNMADDAMRAAHRKFSRNDPRVLQEFMAGIYNINIVNQVGTLDVPTLIMAGEKDPVIPRRMTDRLAKKIAKNSLTVFPVGHMIPAESTDEFISTVNEFVSSL